VLGAVLEGARIRLEPPRADHLPAFVRWFADPEVTRYLQRRHPPSPRQEGAWLESMADSEQDIVWAVVLRDGGDLIGVLGLHRIDWQQRHLWIEISLGEPATWGKGYGTEAVRIATAYAFRELGCEKVLASVYSGNDASLRMLDRLGYRQSGLLRRQTFFGGEWHDEWLGEILREDWKAAD
jgi:RimJ/RimL family protein N-acetyltransferase